MSRTPKPIPAPPDDLPDGRVSRPLGILTCRLDDLPDALGVSRRTIERQRSAGRFPRPDLHIGKMPLWRVETIRAWVEGGGA